jgi:hypothetical protein
MVWPGIAEMMIQKECKRIEISSKKFMLDSEYTENV